MTEPTKEQIEAVASRIRKLRLTTVHGDKEIPCETVSSVFKRGLGGMYSKEVVDYVVKKTLQAFAAVRMKGEG